MKHNWTYKKLGEVCTIERGGSPRPIQKFLTTDKSGLNWIKIGDAVAGSKYISSTKEKIIPEGLKKTRLVHKGDFILSNSMSFGKPYILKIDGCIHDGWLVIHDENNSFDKSFLYYMLGSPSMYKKFSNLAVGGVVNNLNSNIVRKVVIPIPPLEEQRMIVEELDLLQSIIDKKKRQLEELDTLQQSIFYDMFGDPITNEKKWQIKKLIEVVGENCSISYGIVQPGEGVDDGIPVVRPIDMVGDIVRKTNLKKTTKEISNSYKRTILDGDEILMCVRGTTGIVSNSSIELKGCNVTRGIVPIKAGPQINRIFLFRQLKTPALQELIAERTYGATLKQINMKDLRNLPIICPPLALQKEFAEKVESIECQKEMIKKSIADSEQLFAYTMDKYFG